MVIKELMERMSPHRKAGMARRGTQAVVAASVLALSSMAIAPAVAQADTPTNQDWNYSSEYIEGHSGQFPRLSGLIDRIQAQNADGLAYPSTYDGGQGEVSYIQDARAMNLAPDDYQPAQTKDNRQDDPLVVSGSSYQYWEQDRNIILDVYSQSMDRYIPMHVMLPADKDVTSPVLYLLNGAGGGEDSANWSARTDIQQYFQDDNVYVVTPLEGMFSYYTDWQQPEPELHGENKWTTFLTQELPSIMNEAFDTNGKNGIIGMSMSGSSVLSLAEWAHNRGEDGSDGTADNGGTGNGQLYSAVGAFSGCAATSTFPGQQYVDVVTGIRGDIDVTKMWGPYGSDDWKANDAALHAEKLKGVDYIYVASGSGLPGKHDTLENPELNGNSLALGNQIVVGGVLETAVNLCTHDLANRTNAMGMNNIDYNFKPQGTHSWGYWQDDLHISWSKMKEAMGVQG